jgi:hypothetical protein
LIPNENGQREVGAFAKIRVEVEDLMVWRGANENHESFENRIMALQELAQL